LALLGADQPSDFVLRGLVTVGTIQVRRLLFLAFVEKFAFFHKVVGRASLVVGRNRLLFAGRSDSRILIITVLRRTSYGKML
jgi:hypothetical protein